MIGMVVHGGAGGTSPAAEKWCRISAKIGIKVLRDGGSALDATTDSVVSKENSNKFNAGSGAVIRGFTRSGRAIIQMDAVVATSSGFYGAVGAVEDVKNPVLLARIVGTETEHKFVVGPGATSLARMHKLERHPGPSQMALERYSHFQETGEDIRPPDLGENNGNGHASTPLHASSDTVGAIAYDGEMFAIAGSTGGMAGDKRGMALGRVGDVPFRGDGFQVGRLCAVLSTGLGEKIMDVHGADQVYKRIVDMGVHPQQACEEGVARFDPKIAVGFIALAIVDGKLEVGSYSNRGMPSYHIIKEQ